MNIFQHTFALLTCACAASVCSAASVRVTFDNWIFNGSGYDNVNITFPRQLPASGTTTLSAAAGRFQGTASNVLGVPALIFVDGLNDLYMYCYDVYDDIRSGQVVDYTINLNGGLDRTRDFLGAVNAVMNEGISTYDPFAWLHPVNGFQGAAIQLGIWESKYETSADWDLGHGSFRASDLDAPTVIWWNTFKGAIDSTASIDGKYVMTLEAVGAQDMITGDPPANVPEPGSVALIGVGLAALAFARRNKAQE